MIQIVLYRDICTNLMIQSDVVFTNPMEKCEVLNKKETNGIDVHIVPLENLNITKYIYPTTKDYIGGIVIFKKDNKSWIEHITINDLNERLETDRILEVSILNIVYPFVSLSLYPELVRRRVWRYQRYIGEK